MSVVLASVILLRCFLAVGPMSYTPEERHDPALDIGYWRSGAGSLKYVLQTQVFVPSTDRSEHNKQYTFCNHANNTLAWRQSSHQLVAIRLTSR